MARLQGPKKVKLLVSFENRQTARRNEKMTRPGKDYKSELLKRLKDPKLAEAYINAALEHGTQEELLVALKNVCEAHGMARTARKAKINRENMYRVLSAKGNPHLSTFTSIIESTGLKLRVRAG